MSQLIILSVNNSWNILNFRAGLVRRIQAAGYAVAVVSPDDAHATRLADLGVVHLAAAVDSKGLSPVADLELLARYRAIFREHRPAALMTWTIKPNIYGSIAAHMSGIPVINNVSGLGTVFIRRSLVTAIVSTLYRLAFSRSATVFFQNPDDRHLFIEKRLVAESRTTLLPGSGIDTCKFAPSVRSTDQGDVSQAFTFLLVARLLRDKGIGEYVQAARMVRGRYPGARFQILGVADADNRTAISRQELAAWMDEGVISYLGAAEDVRPHIGAADCIVLPSYREGMPRALLEGAALAKPLIATRVPGCTEIARDGVNALLCTVRDPVSLAAAMTRMVELPPERRQQMGLAGRRIAITEFDEGIVTDRYMAALDRALADVR